MITRRNVLVTSLASAVGAVLGRRAASGQHEHMHMPPAAPAPTAAPPPPSAPPTAATVPSQPHAGRLPYTPVVTPNGTTLPWRWEDGRKTFHLVAEPVVRELAPGLHINAWGYNGQTPGPTIEAVEGDRVRIYVQNRLPEPTSIHWHGVLLPNGMDGVAGLNQPRIEPGQTFVYEFDVRQHGTNMYHPHFDEMVQQAMGMMGFLVFHPRRAPRRIDRDFAIFLAEWAIKPGTATPDPTVMTDFNLFTFNSRVFPGIAPLVVRRGDRVRLRIANISMDSHPIHVHGHHFRWTGTDAGPIPETAWIPETSINVPPGTTRDVEFVADNPGDWGVHCHKVHHTMNQMGHGLPVLLGVDTRATEAELQRLAPGGMIMGQTGMGDMHAMGSMHGMAAAPRNTLPMGGGEGPFGTIFMGGMFTVLKVREALVSYDEDPGWYAQPAGTTARLVETPPRRG